MANPIRFLEEVKREVLKVTWPSRQETSMTTVVVFIFVIIAALFFLLADYIISESVRSVLGIQ